MNKKILIVEDESIIAMEIESYLSSKGYQIIGICSTANDAYEKALKSDVLSFPTSSFWECLLEKV